MNGANELECYFTLGLTGLQVTKTLALGLFVSYKQREVLWIWSQTPIHLISDLFKRWNELSEFYNH